MENVVAARRLRKSVLKEISYNDIHKIGEMSNSKNSQKYKTISERIGKNKKINYKTKVLIKTFISVLIVFTCLFCKLVIKDKIVKNGKIEYIISEYNKDLSKEDVTNITENLISKVYKKISYVVPENLKNSAKEKYYNIIKPTYLDFELYPFVNSLISNENDENSTVVIEENKNEKEDNEEELGVGGADTSSEEKYEESISAISSMNQDVEEIRNKNISMIKPTTGTITSIYGARDEIFEGVNSYHTGIDIANKQGTKIISSTAGKVVAAVNGNKYYGNYVEVDTSGVIFKYAHMQSISVKEGEYINQGDEVGLMGSTGMSTGPHLHFEIKINSKTVDPQELLDL